MSLRRSESETEVHKLCADEDLVIDDYHREKKRKTGTIDSQSAPVPNNDDWPKELIAELLFMLSPPVPDKDGLMKPAPGTSWCSRQPPQKDDFCWKMKPTFLGERGKSALALYSTQVSQKAPHGEEEFKTVMTKPLCEESVPCFRLPVSPSCDKQGPAPCGICDGAHHHSACDLRISCPTDKAVGNGFMVICFCGNFLIDGKCRHGCPPRGVVIRDKTYYQTPRVSEIFPTKSNKYI